MHSIDITNNDQKSVFICMQWSLGLSAPKSSYYAFWNFFLPIIPKIMLTAPIILKIMPI